MSKHKIAVIRGDGIGVEVVGEALKVLKAAGSKFGIDWTFDELPWSSAYYDDHGQITDPGTPAHEGREGRPAYTCYDVVLDTMRPGAQVAAGFVEGVITPKALEVTEGYLPALGDDVEWPIRGFQKWYGAPGRRRSTNGYSFAGDVYAAERSQGKRSVSAVAANAS